VKGSLLDTHALLWMVLDDSRLSRAARSRMQKTDRLAYSAASLWEIALKLSRGSFDFTLPHAWHHDLIRELREIGVGRIEIEPEHCRCLQDLPWHHKDPFDRMLIAQAQFEDLSILTADPRFKEYEIKVVW
jgi:PIN domain nuclease of toxin-antitoxin system